MGFLNVKFLTVKYPEEFTQEELEVLESEEYEIRQCDECGPCVDEETCSKLRKGTTVSVLGRLKRFMGICIEAQHISIKDRRKI